MHLKLKDLLVIGEEKAKPKSVKVVKKFPKSMKIVNNLPFNSLPQTKLF